MLVALILSSVFIGGFFLGYGTRAWRSNKHQAGTSHKTSSHTTTFGHARRAF
jgi:hypothetical protein